MKRNSPLLFLVLLHAVVLAAGFFAPYDYEEQHRDHPYEPPSRVHWRGLRPHVFAGDDPSRAYPIRLFPGNGRLFGVDAPGVLFLFGSDAFGRDVFSRVLYGGRISLFTGLAAALLSLGLALLMGTVAGYFGRRSDELVMRGSELVWALPWLYILLAVRSLLPLHIGPWQAALLLTLVLGSLGWVRPARLIRGVVLAEREQPYVQAARGFGASSFYCIIRHILPATTGVLLTQASVLIPRYVLAEITLSFLGLGVGEPVPSWGNMAAEAGRYHVLVSDWWMLAPLMAVVPVVLAYVLLAKRFEEPAKYRI